jgi:hypothetical protein
MMFFGFSSWLAYNFYLQLLLVVITVMRTLFAEMEISLAEFIELVTLQ